MTPIDESQPISGLTPQEEANRKAVEAAVAEEKKVKEEWGKFKEVINQFQDRTTAQYGEKFKVIKTIEEDTPVYINGVYGRGEGMAFWKVTVDNRQVFAFPQFQGLCNGEFGDYIVLADGTTHRVEKNRWGDSRLNIDAKISSISEPNLKGERYPLFANAQNLGEKITINNYDDLRKKDNIYGLGGLVKAGGHDIKIEYNHIVNNSSKNIQETRDMLASTLASKQ